MGARSVSVVVMVVVCVAGCASVRRTYDDWIGSDVGTEASSEGTPYFSAVDGLAVHADAAGGSAVVGRLAQYERVVRTRLVSGWAYVTSASGLAGWVDNAQLIWRLPAATPSAAERRDDASGARPDAVPGASPAPAAPAATTAPGTTGAPDALAPASAPAAKSAPDAPAPTPAPQPTAASDAAPASDADAPAVEATAAAQPTPHAHHHRAPGMFDPY